jgi:hypothetical protein
LELCSSLPATEFWPLHWPWADLRFEGGQWYFVSKSQQKVQYNRRSTPIKNC